MQEVIEGWKVGSVYLTENGDQVKISQINTPLSETLTVESRDGTFWAYDLNGNPLSRQGPFKLMKLLSGTIGFEKDK